MTKSDEVCLLEKKPASSSKIKQQSMLGMATCGFLVFAILFTAAWNKFTAVTNHVVKHDLNVVFVGMHMTKKNDFAARSVHGKRLKFRKSLINSCEPINVMSCGTPLPGRGYDGKLVYASSIKSVVDIPSRPDFVFMDTCGQYNVESELNVPLTSFRNKSTSTYPWYTNAWCELDVQRVAMLSFANRDYFMQAKALDLSIFSLPDGTKFSYDFWYCRYNGWLNVSSRTAARDGFDVLRRYSMTFCANRAQEFNVSNLTINDFFWIYGSSMARGFPNEFEARWLGAWLCAMGGSTGKSETNSDGCGPDIAYCVYTYGDLYYTQPGHFCMYEECDGWDPITGMPVSNVQTASHGYLLPAHVPNSVIPPP